jgi:hypothetical protein
LVDGDYPGRFDGIIDIYERNLVRPFSQPGATVLAGKRLDQSGASQREKQPAHDDWNLLSSTNFFA